MGCDIHMVIEKSVAIDDWIVIGIPSGWDSNVASEYGNFWFSPPCLSRNYERFGALAGVRSEGPPPRGLPVDACASTRYLADSQEYHSHSWLTLTDAARVFLETDGNTSDLAKRFPCSYYFNIDSELADDCRLVFWFDN